MPIYTSEVKKGKLSHIALSGAIFNATNFTQLEQSSVRLDVGTESNPITVDGSTVNPFYFLKFFTHLGDPGSFAYSALLINRALQPGEEIIISGYFFRGSDPNTDNNNEFVILLDSLSLLKFSLTLLIVFEITFTNKNILS